MLARLQDLQQALQPLGLTLNLSKGKLWGPGILAADQTEPSFPEGLAADHPGRAVTIVPVGGDCGITSLGVPIDAPKGIPGRDTSVAPECQIRWGKAVEQATLILERL